MGRQVLAPGLPVSRLNRRPCFRPAQLWIRDMATAIPFAETAPQPTPRRVTAGSIIGAAVFAAAVFAIALALIL